MIASLLAAAALAAAPEMFAPGVISNPVITTAPTFSPDGGTVYYQRQEGKAVTIVASHRTEASWGAAEPLPLPEGWRYIEPALSPDGGYMLFASNRPADGSSKPLDGFWGGKTWPGRGGAIWRIDARPGGGWSAPRPLPAEINQGTSVFEPALTRAGVLYFMRPHDGGKFELFRAEPRSGGYGQAQPMPFWKEGVGDVDPAVAADDSYLIFASNRGTPNQLGLYVVFRKGQGWSAPVAFPEAINAPGSITEPHLSADEQTLYFSRNLVIWQVPLQPILQELRAKAA